MLLKLSVSQRRNNEAQRIENEEERQANELVRKGNENDRESAEAARALAESGRVEAEAARVIAENQRQATYASKEDVNNKVSAWEDVPDNDHYPSEKLLKDSLDALPATATPLMDGTAAVGSSSKLAKEDHVHPTDTSRVPTSRTVNSKALYDDITLNAGDIGYSDSATYSSDTVGDELQSQAERIDVSGVK